MNRLAVGLAVGAGYLLGRTKKAKFAFAVGTMVAGRKMQLGPAGIARAVSQQMEKNPQFKEIGDQLRQDLRGVGKAATGSLLDRRIEGLADRLHERTLDVRDRLSGAVPDEVPDADESADKARDAGESTGAAAKPGTRKTGSATKKATSAARGATKKSTTSRSRKRTEDSAASADRAASADDEPEQQSTQRPQRKRAPAGKAQSARGSQKRSTQARSTQQRSGAKKTARAKGGNDG
ncbi:hypothetical protein [Streptomyces aureocirculatus]|uniref:hypothetical protein n=1 Tax=Streptomyces aureocirculatus TaxID=67275 RepID=UPI0004C931A1|nr:hypothetical protein [Streptomyces aureocirculatus]